MMADNIIWLDFNDAPEQRDELASDTDALRTGLMGRLEAVLHYLFPQGRIRGGKFTIGDVDGNPGKSLVVELDGSRRGLWKDFSTDEGGDIIDLWARSQGRSARSDFPRIAGEIRQWLGLAAPIGTLGRRESRATPVDDLGAYTGKWDYLSPEGELIACVYRYDPPTGKEYRPWDVRARMWRAPDPRPLYNLPVISKAREVVLVEGEKCAAALIACGVAATTAMNGAKAPVDKTDWHPLAGKSVVIWPDRDAPGWDYAESAARACVAAGCTSVAILVPPTDKPAKWDAADAVDEGFDCAAFISQGERRVVKAATPSLPTFTLGELLDDQSPLPPDLISPRVLTPAGMLVFGGAPKVGKSDFLLSWLAHMAAGAAFLGMQPPRPLRVFYLQAEVQYHYLRERVKDVRLPSHRLPDARANFVATPQLRLVLDDAGLAQVIPAIANAFSGEPPDIIAIDPIRNVFDGGDEYGKSGGENDNGAMLFFLSQRVERIRQAVNPDAGIILAHHTRKLGKKQFEEDPFQALAGAGSLRGYYSTGMLLFRPDETRTTRQLIYELRNGAGIPLKHIDKVQGEWREVDANDRLVMKEYGERLDAERRRKRDAILEILFQEAANGRCYTANQFAEGFEGKAGLGGERTIRERLSALATQGYIKYFRNAADYGLPSCGRTKFGYLCVEGMALQMAIGSPDLETGEVVIESRPVLPTHYKCPQSGAAMPVENPEVWVYQDDLNDIQEPA
ncbi:AAA family ATPase [Burkholderia multivorans]|uniref:AAA family ATPase n=1 Tax=Burkholderia multivorans TaxID=87883 RepID=UPI001C27DBEB|nr:AAA family ATPase [Burkholderia multivorans]MBU9576432.1 AAA family ATPase [Burkholderia multivorans]